MIYLNVAFVFGGIFFIHIYDMTDGQHSEFPNLFYKPMTFDYSLRGSFNISECTKEIMACWEIIRGDVICHYGVKHKDVCSYMRDLCHDVYGDLDLVWFDYVLYQPFCINDNIT